MLHYWCFFLDSACENQRRHPFLREAVQGSCQNAATDWMRQRTEMEVCIGQETPASGYLLKSQHVPHLTTKWCQGRMRNNKPTNYQPYSIARKANCPLAPPAPRWPNAHSYCLPKPVTTDKRYLECPKEQFPEYEWNWDWQDYIADHHHHHNQFSAVTSNTIFAGYHNINPTNDIASVVPWKYLLNDYTPRITPYAKPDPSNPNEKDVLYESVENYKFYLSNYNGSMIPQKKCSYPGVCKYELGYQEYTHYPLNRLFIRTQAPFNQEIGWMFWDTEDSTDDWDSEKELQVAIDPTPTHMAVADHFKIETSGWDVVCDSGDPSCIPKNFTEMDILRGGKPENHDIRENKNIDYGNLLFFQVLRPEVQECSFAVPLSPKTNRKKQCIICIGLMAICVYMVTVLLMLLYTNFNRVVSVGIVKMENNQLGFRKFMAIKFILTVLMML
eukprot:TRINITY_DN853_c0_g1_i1.p1 TRINITY_DN853_c0_g1~~TRINITY_DN853_c0_g1_i1.p1  ORF type:complete len:443 (-),score=50.34 TRINITY_DN853_c0_g1_i1:668-1996(-)